MRKLNSRALTDLLKDPDQTQHSNLAFTLEKDLIINFSDLSGGNEFEDCEFYGGNILIEGSKQHRNFKALSFQKCKFDQDLTLSECIFKHFSISNSVSPKNIFVKGSTIQKFHLTEIENSIQKIEIKDSKFTHLLLRNLNQVDELVLDQKCMVSAEADFNLCDFGKFDIKNCHFKNDLCCLASQINQESQISDCEINNLDFGFSEFKQLLLNTCTIEGISKFELLRGESTILKVFNCNFHKHVDLETTPIKEIWIMKSKFMDTVSFQNTMVNTIYFNKVLFEKLAYFDGIEINQIEDCDIRSIRTIKQQLLLADNKIDYVRFRRYELDLYRLESKELLLEKKYRGDKYRWFGPIMRNDKFYLSDGSYLDHLHPNIDEEKLPKINKLDLLGDYVILTLHQLTSKYGTDWKRSVFVTLVIGVAFYSLLFYSINSSRELLINSHTVNNYMNGLPRYFLVTDFTNPLKEKGYYDNSISWIPLIIGKIMIAFGIYETIQSFRKFKK